MLIGLVGKARSGKGTVANLLEMEYGYWQTAFAFPLKNMLNMAGLCNSDELWGEKTARSRELLQKIGTDIFRKQIDPDFWLKMAQTSIKEHRGQGVEKIVFEDIRFPNEAKLIRDNGGIIVKMIRVGHTDSNAGETHASENQIDAIHADHIIEAPSGDVEGLKNLARMVLNGMFDRAIRDAALQDKHEEAIETLETEIRNTEMIKGYIARDERGDLNFHTVLPTHMAGGMETFSYWFSPNPTHLPVDWFPHLKADSEPEPFNILAIKAMEGTSAPDSSN